MKKKLRIQNSEFRIKIQNNVYKILNTKRGFTLIELLIAVAIIGILTTLLMANFIAVRQRARDAQRKSDLRQIQAALELYRSDQGLYPAIYGVPLSSAANCDGYTSLKSPDCSSTTYMKKVPTDPSGSSYYNGGVYFFASYTAGVSYDLLACLENKNDPQGVSHPEFGGICPTQYFYIVQNP